MNIKTFFEQQELFINQNDDCIHNEASRQFRGVRYKVVNKSRFYEVDFENNRYRFADNPINDIGDGGSYSEWEQYDSNNLPEGIKQLKIIQLHTETIVKESITNFEEDNSSISQVQYFLQHYYNLANQPHIPLDSQGNPISNPAPINKIVVENESGFTAIEIEAFNIFLDNLVIT